MKTLFPALEPNEYSPHLLAYIGDVIFELFFRYKIIKDEKFQVRKAHRKVVNIVNAKTQSEIIEKISPHLNEEQSAIVKKARNKKFTSHPKNVSMAEYRYATALESLLGYYFLKQDYDTLTRLFHLIEDSLNENEE